MMHLPNENSRATILHGYVREHMHETGDVVTYAELRDMLDIDVDDSLASNVLSGVIAVVNKRLHRDGDHRHLVNVATVGYKVAAPADIRNETLGRLRHIDRQQVMAMRAMEKVPRHPDSTPAERARAADAIALQSALLGVVRREHRRIRTAWPAEEASPVVEGDS